MYYRKHQQDVRLLVLAGFGHWRQLPRDQPPPSYPPTNPSLPSGRIDVTSSKQLLERAASEFADAYAASELCRSNEAEMDALLAAAPQRDGNSHRHSRARSLLQLGGPQGTITPWWWGLWVLFRFRTGG